MVWSAAHHLHLGTLGKLERRFAEIGDDQAFAGLRHAVAEQSALFVHDALAVFLGADHLERIAPRHEAVHGGDGEDVVVFDAAQGAV